MLIWFKLWKRLAVLQPYVSFSHPSVLHPPPSPIPLSSVLPSPPPPCLASYPPRALFLLPLISDPFSSVRALSSELQLLIDYDYFSVSRGLTRQAPHWTEGPGCHGNADMPHRAAGLPVWCQSKQQPGLVIRRETVFLSCRFALFLSSVRRRCRGNSLVTSLFRNVRWTL